MTKANETSTSPALRAREMIPLSARATGAKLRISVSPTHSVRPISAHVKEPDGTAWRVITMTVDGIVRWYGDPPYPSCRGNCWIDLEVECPHDHPPSEAKPTELCGVVLCEASDLPVSTCETERDRQWEKGSRKPRGAHKLANDEWETTFRGDSSPSIATPQNSMWINEPRCRTCDGVMQKNLDHVGDCSSDCFGTFVHKQPLLRPCDFASCNSSHGAVIYVPRRDEPLEIAPTTQDGEE